MTENLDPIALLVAELDAISDPGERFQETVSKEREFDAEIRGVKQRIAQQLRAKKVTYREIGALMGGVSAQRAEQIAKGRGGGKGHDIESTDPRA